MKITVFSRKAKTNDGRAFNVFVSSLTKNDGTSQYVTVRYSGKDKNKEFDSARCPYIIEFNKEDANLSSKSFEDKKTGEKRKNCTLWIKDYKESDEVYVDHSLDDFI